MILDIDIGNTRLKWQLGDLDGRRLCRGVAMHSEWRESGLKIATPVARVRICSVNGEFSSEISAYCQRQLGVEPEFAGVVSGVAGLTCGYRDTALLGVDRWLATLACWQYVSKRALVVSAGTALTIDALDGGQHLGGYILPGLALMRGALGRGTWGVNAGPSGSLEPVPGVDTDEAVGNGSLLALVGAVEKAAETSRLDLVVLTGGDSPLLKRYLSSRLRLIEAPDLVLDGLAVALP